MGLVYPLNPSSDCNVAQQNLSTLLCAKNSGEDVTSLVARNAFQDYQNASLGFGHQVKKFTVSVAAYGAAIGLPVGAVVGATYWFVKDYISKPSQALYDLGAAFYNNRPAFSANIPIIGRFAPYTTPAFCLGTLAGIALVDRAFKERYNMTPIKSVAKWSVNMMSSVLLYAAYKAGELATSSFAQEELEKGESRKYSHQKIIEQLKCIYDDVAQSFSDDYENAENSPKEMMKFKHTAEQLEENFPYIKSQLEALDLRSFEIDQIMGELIGVTATIKESALGLKDTGSKDDDRYNTELILTLPKWDIPALAVTNEVKSHIKIAQYNDLGAAHTFNSIVKSGASGVATTASIELAVPALFAAVTYLAGVDIEPKSAMIVGATLAIIPALQEGSSVANKMFKGFCDEREKADERKAEQIKLAHNKLLGVYDGIALHLTQRYIKAKNDPVAMDQLQADARNFLSKFTLLEGEIANVSMLENHQEITENLRQILAVLV